MSWSGIFSVLFELYLQVVDNKLNLDALAKYIKEN